MHIKHTYEDKIQEMKKDDFYSDADWEHVCMWMGKLSEGIGDEQARHDPSHVVRGLQSMFRAASQALVRHSDPVRPTSLGGIDEEEEDSEDEDDVVVVEAEDGEQFHACASHALLDTSALNEANMGSSRRLKSTISRVMNRADLRQWGVGGLSHRTTNSGRHGVPGAGGLGVLAEHDEYDEDEKEMPAGRSMRHNLSVSERAQNVFVRDRLQRQSSSDDEHAGPYSGVAAAGSGPPHVQTGAPVPGVHGGSTGGSARSSPSGRTPAERATRRQQQFSASISGGARNATLSTSFVDAHP